MPNNRRAHIPGGTFFFTVKTERNAPIFQEQAAVGMLRNIIREMQRKWPFDIDAIVLLPDHLHTIWTLPSGDADFSTLWAWLKKEFTKQFLASGGQEQTVLTSRSKNRSLACLDHS